MRSVTDRMYRGIGLCREGHPKEAPARQAEAGVEEIKFRNSIHSYGDRQSTALDLWLQPEKCHNVRPPMQLRRAGGMA